MSTFLSRRWKLDRRTFLRGVGAVIALPLLDAMQPLTAADAGAKAAMGKPKRAVFLYIPNGVNMRTWQITKAGRDYELSASMRHLQRHREHITPISGLHHPNAQGAGHTVGDSWLTGAFISPGSSAKYKNTVSCDQLMAEVTAPQTRFSSLELSIESGTGQPMNSRTMAFTRDGSGLPADDSPRVVFDRLFRDNAGGITVQRARIDRQRSVLDAVLGRANALKKDLGTNDRGKLDGYLQSVREVEVRTQRMEHWLTIPKPKVDDEQKFNQNKDFAGHYWDAMLDLIVLALRTDMTRVVTYMTGCEQVGIPVLEIGVSNSRHELSHHNGIPDMLNKLSSYDGYMVEKLAKFMDNLKSIDEGGETLLDRTMILFGSGMSYGHSHGNANLPIIVAGGRSLGLKHGQHIDYNLRKLKAYDLNNLEASSHSPVN
jgi:hypothetical protein